MDLTIVNIQILHRGKFVSDPVLRYEAGEVFGGILSADIDQLHILQFHKWATDLGYVRVEKFACRVNKIGPYHFISSDADVLDFCRYLRQGDFIEVCMCHCIDEPHVIEDLQEDISVASNVGPRGGQYNTGGSTEMPHVFNAGATNAPNPNDINTAAKEKNTSGKGKEKVVEVEETSDSESKSEGQYYDFSSYHLATESEDEDYEVESEEDDTDDSLYDVDEDYAEEVSDIDEELLSTRQSKIKEKKTKLKSAEVNLDDIPSGPVGIDPGFEDIYKDKQGKYAGKLGGDEEYLDSSDPGSEDSDDEDIGEDGIRNVQPRKARRKVYYDITAKKSFFQLDMIFENAKQFRSALQNYAVQRRVQIRLRPNEKHRVRATCLTEGCRWHILASIEGRSGDFIVKSYHPVHKCLKVSRNKSANTSWIIRHFQDRIISHPQIKLKELQLLIKKKFKVYVGKTICARAKYKVMAEHMGDWREEFGRIYDYADMIRATNPGSTVAVKTSKESVPGKELFMGIYICLHALKTGFKEGCRPIFGVDGAFLKGVCQGEILSCIAKDGNNQMYPVAWAVVNKETKHTWSWFFRCIMHDRNLEESAGEGMTIVSDMQKGLLEAVKDLMPKAEHRWCARHIWSNWHKTWPGEERRLKFWAVAKSSFEVGLKDKVDELAELGDNIVESLLTYPKESWCRAYFNCNSKSDVVENNMCETFNSWIVGPRHKSIITMLEEIRHKIMERFTKMREFCMKWDHDVSPMALGCIDKQTDKAAECEVVWNGDTGFEVLDEDYNNKYRHSVDMRNRECSCRSWQLKGIPCAHAICAMLSRGLDPLEFVDHWYRKETYMKAYSTFIQPITNMKMWPPSQNPHVEPPAFTRMPGRPRKNRRKAADEPRKKCGKRSRKGTPMTCSHCKLTGHNKKGCPVLKAHGSAATAGAGSSNTQTDHVASEHAPEGSQSRTQPTATKNVRTGGTATSRPSGGAAGWFNIAGKFQRQGSNATTPNNVQNTTASRPSGGAGTGPSGGGASRPSGGAAKRCPRAAGFGILFSKSGAVIQRSGTRDRVLHDPGTIKNAAQKDVDLGYKPHGLMWNKKRAVTTRQLQEEMLRRRQYGPQGATTSSQPDLQQTQPNLSQFQANYFQSQP